MIFKYRICILLVWTFSIFSTGNRDLARFIRCCDYTSFKSEFVQSKADIYDIYDDEFYFTMAMRIYSEAHPYEKNDILNILNFLIEQGFDVNIYYRGETLLHIVKNIDMLQFLIEKGANRDAQTKYGNTPLHYHMLGSSDYREKVVRFFLNSGVNTSLRDHKGLTAYQKAVLHENTRIVDVFLQDQRQKSLKRSFSLSNCNILVGNKRTKQ